MDITRLEFYVADALAVYLPHQQPQKITGSKDASLMLFQYWSNRIQWLEEFYIMALNPAMQVLGIYHVASGGLNQCYVDARVVFQIALGCKAHSIILAHNHPTGNTEPSQSDKTITERLKAVGDLLGVKVLDHIIVTADPSQYYSFADQGIINNQSTISHYVHDSIHSRVETIDF